MPSIKKNDEQQRALNTITESLEYLEDLYQVAKGKAYDAIITFDMGKRSPRAKGNKFVIKADDKDMKKLLRILMDAGKRESKNIEALAKQFDIELTKEEMKLVAMFGNQKGAEDFGKDDDDGEPVPEQEPGDDNTSAEDAAPSEEPQEAPQEAQEGDMGEYHPETPAMQQEGAEQGQEPYSDASDGGDDDDDEDDARTNAELAAAMQQFM